MMRLAAVGVPLAGLVVVAHPPPLAAGTLDQVSRQEASQLALALTLTTPLLLVRVFAVTVPVQSLGL